MERLPAGQFRERFRKTIRTAYFSLKEKENGGAADRIGIIVGTAVHKNAVKRNFWRRQARETMRGALRGKEKKDGGCDFLLILSPQVAALTKKQFREKLAAAIREVN